MGWLWDLIFGWEEIFVTQDISQYMKKKTELNNKGIKTRSRFVNHSSSNRGIGTMGNFCTYYIYVKKQK